MAEISAALKGAITSAIVAGVSAAAVSPTNDLTSKDVAPVTETVVNKAVQQIANNPVMVNATNSEPWYQSRVVLGAVTTLLSSGFAIGALISVRSTDAELYALPIVTGFGAAFTLYGRLKTGLKPLFS